MQNEGQERHSWIKLTVVLSILFLIGILTVAGGEGNVDLNYDNPNMLLLLKILQAFSVIVIFIIPAVFIAIFWTRPKIHYLGITKRPAFLTLLIAGAAILLANPLINWLTEINAHMHLPAAFSGIEEWMRKSEDKATELTNMFTKGTSVSDLLLNLFVIAFMAALSEEIFFRGILQKVAAECFGNRHVAVWFGAIIFSAFHMQFYGFLPRVLMGAYLGYLFLWTGSLWPGILAHFINNGVFVFFTWLVNNGIIAPETKTSLDETGLGYVAVSTVIVVASLWTIYRIEKKRELKLTLAAESSSQRF
ncbi:MAG: peptidase [Bacteroidetes bacterium]|nr:peptidase [Bacteroidota bacterium]